MDLTRKELLGSGAATAAALAACGDTGTATSAPPKGKWARARHDLGLAKGTRNFTAFLLAPHPAPVRRAIERHRRGLDANPAGYLHDREEQLDEAVVRAAASYLGVPGDELAFTDSTTMGLATFYGGLRLEPGDRVLTTEHDHYATHESLRLAALRSGATVERVRLHDEPQSASAQEMVQRLVAGLTPATRLVALTWVHSSTGVKLPVAAMAKAVKAARPDALVVVDAVHALAAEDVQPRALGVDALIAGCHKWLFGPRGTGIVWARAAAWQRADPVIPSFSGAAYGAWLEGRTPPREPSGPVFTPGGFHSFEHRWALAQAFAWNAKLGRGAVSDRVHELAGKLHAGLSAIDGVRVRTPADPELRSGLVCFELPGQDPGEVVARLAAKRIVASVTPYATRYVRLGTSLAIDEADVRAALAAVRALA